MTKILKEREIHKERVGKGREPGVGYFQSAETMNHVCQSTLAIPGAKFLNKDYDHLWRRSVEIVYNTAVSMLE